MQSLRLFLLPHIHNLPESSSYSLVYSPYPKSRLVTTSLFFASLTAFSPTPPHKANSTPLHLASIPHHINLCSPGLDAGGMQSRPGSWQALHKPLASTRKTCPRYSQEHIVGGLQLHMKAGISSTSVLNLPSKYVVGPPDISQPRTVRNRSPSNINRHRKKACFGDCS